MSLQVERDGPVARLMLVGPGKGNAMGPDFWRELEAGLRYVSAWNAAFLPSEDLAEAMRAFGQRRPPRFTGR